ncbi:MAG: hypothetical protein HZA91_12090 [Verrucomicrobia bacterium]|nr:hypothetical protein [Verrucomicrobiota bacterium]
MRCLDYGSSFICHSGRANAVRFWVESRTRLIDERSGATTDFHQCASCKSENTFGEKGLFYPDNYDFLPIIGGGHYLIFRRKARLNPDYRTVRAKLDAWGDSVLKLREAAAVTALDTWEKIRDATAAAIPIVTQTEIVHRGTCQRAIIECPVKTMNISLENRRYQVDTGPVAFPDLAQRHDPAINCLSLAFIAFNAPHFADFVIEQPTPVIEGDKEMCRIHHYSNPISLLATNTIFALGKL